MTWAISPCTFYYLVGHSVKLLINHNRRFTCYQLKATEFYNNLTFRLGLSRCSALLEKLKILH